jgi:hypothetical protein
MKRHILLSTLAAALVSIAVEIPASAENALANSFGVLAPANAAARQIPIKPDTKWVEVKQGETVQFIINNDTFSWRFNGDNTMSEIDLNKIAPAGMLNQKVEVYIDHLPANYRG